MRKLLAAATAALLLGCEKPEQPEPFPVGPPTLSFTLHDSLSGSNLFPGSNRLGLHPGDHVDSVKLFDEDWDPIAMERYRDAAEGGFYFPGIDFTIVDGDYMISKTEVARKLFLKINAASLDSIEILYRYRNRGTTDSLEVEYVKVFFDAQYIGGTYADPHGVQAKFYK